MSQIQPRPNQMSFDAYGLPHNDDLVYLPPVPESPRHESSPTRPSHRSTTAMAEPATGSVARGIEWPRTISENCLVDNNPAKVTSPTKVVRSASSRSLPRSDSTRFSPVKYPTLSTRQSSMNTPRKLFVSPLPLPLPTALPAPTISHTDESFSTSALMPHLKNMSGSLIGDDSANAPSSSGDSSLDFNIEDLRPSKRDTRGLPRPEELGYANERKEHGGSTTPTQSRLTMKPSAAMWFPKELTLLPELPTKAVHMSGSIDAITNIQPPWGDGSQSMNDSPVKSNEVFMSPVRQTSRSSPSPSLSRRGPPSSTRSKRTFPASSSAQTLDSLSEEPVGGPSADLDKSVLLPMSPNKARPEDHESLLRMSLPLDELSMSMNIPLPEPKPRSHRKSIRPMMQQSADKTMDIGELMALMRKPKRASGTEESFADLLHADDAPEGMDQSLMMDDVFLPASLRPRSSPTKPLTSTSSRSISSSSARTARRRSKSLSEASPLTIASPEKLKSPPKTASTTRTYTTVRNSAAARQSILPSSATKTTSKRVSLSAGALSMPTSASHRTMALPSARTGVSRSGLQADMTVKKESSSSASSRAPRESLAVPAVQRKAVSPSAMTETARRTLLPPPPANRPSARAGSHIQTATGGLPRPGPGSTARSARPFGTDGGLTLNRLSKPATSTTTLPISSKLSTGPVQASPAKQRTIPSSRAKSTPATALTRPSAIDHVRRPTAPSAAIPTISKDQKPRAGSALPRPTVSRLPMVGRKSSNPSLSSTAESIAGLRERLDKLQARQAKAQVSRR